MNNIKTNIFNKNEIENELKNFKEGQDYSVYPSDEPNIKTYNFHNDILRSWFKVDRVPVRITREAYDGNDYSYRGHFEEGKNYYYSCQTWLGNPPTDEDGWRPISEEMWKSSNGDYKTIGIRGRRLENNENNYLDNGEVEEHRKTLMELEKEKKLYQDRIAGMSEHIAIAHHIEDEKGREHERELRDYEKTLAEINDKIRYHENWLARNGNFNGKPAGCCNCGFKDIRPQDSYCQKCGAELCDKAKNSDLAQENRQLRQQLASVQRQLSEVLAELKKLKRDLSGQDREKLDQQIIRNERLLENGEKVSLFEVQEQVSNSQALMKELGVGVSTNQDNKNGSGALPYVIGGSVIVATVALIGYCLVKKNKRKVRTN